MTGPGRKLVHLKEDQVKAILAVLPVRSTKPYYAERPERSAEDIGAENEQWTETIREMLESLRVDSELAKDIEKLRKEILTILSAVPLQSFSKEIPKELGYLSDQEIDEITSLFDAWYPDTLEIEGVIQRHPKNLPENGLYIARPDTLWFLTIREADRQTEYLKSKLKNVTTDKEPKYRKALVSRLKTVIYQRYIKATLPPGTSIGTV